MRKIFLSSVAALIMSVPGLSARAADKDILDTLKADDRFTTLVQAIEKANLTESLRSGTWTLFAPVNDAFKAVPDWDATMQDTAKLSKMLNNHLIKENLSSSDASREVASAGEMKYKVDFAAKKVAEASITQADWKATNGTIHVIDRVLMPGEKTAEATPLLRDWLFDPLKSLVSSVVPPLAPNAAQASAAGNSAQ
ncbi:MAG TPA: fasciclin domain-containing protein [Planctomycetota bacterium]|nr:fasciclin domain-containing protein [Planctomycetota bacterium]